jgi:hypothetical protein
MAAFTAPPRTRIALWPDYLRHARGILRLLGVLPAWRVKLDFDPIHYKSLQLNKGNLPIASPTHDAGVQNELRC